MKSTFFCGPQINGSGQQVGCTRRIFMPNDYCNTLYDTYVTDDFLCDNEQFHVRLWMINVCLYTKDPSHYLIVEHVFAYVQNQ